MNKIQSTYMYFIALVAVLLPTPVLFASQSVDRTIDASANVELTVECIAGNLKFVGWDRNEVSIRGTVGDDARVEIGGDDRTIDIEIALPEHRGRLKVFADLEIYLPRQASIEVEGLSTSTTVSDFSGRVDIETMRRRRALRRLRNCLC